MLRDGVTLVRTSTGPLAMPSADVEIDLDAEWDTDGRVYLSGALVNAGGAARCQEFVSWELLDGGGERALAEQAAGWLRTVVSDVGDAGRSARVFHYTLPAAAPAADPRRGRRP